MLAARTRVVEREAVTTDQLGVADFIFVNASRLLVGPDCAVALDHRFYDPVLDTEVKEVSLQTPLLCIAKAENLATTGSRDRIVINSPRGKIVIAGAAALIALSDDEEAEGLPQRGNPVSAPLQVSVSAVRPGGFVSLDGGEADETRIVRRPGFVLWMDSEGEVRGPDRETSQKRRQLEQALEGVAEPTFGSNWSGDLVLAPLSAGPRPAIPPQTCLYDACENVLDTEAAP